MPDAQRIVIRIKKGTDGRTTLSCTRADRTTTWQRQEGGQAAFFPKHDLTHCAVETALGQRGGFTAWFRLAGISLTLAVRGHAANSLSRRTSRK